MQILSEIIKNIVVIVLITTFLDLLLPSSTMQRYVKFVMGLFILVSIINPVINLLAGNADYEVLAWQGNGLSENEEVKIKGEELRAVNQDLLLAGYGQRMEQQMEIMVKLVKGVHSVKAHVEIKSGGQTGSVEGIQKVTLEINRPAKPVEPVEIKIDPKEPKEIRHPVDKEEIAIKQEATDILCQFFGVKPEQVQVIFPKTEVRE